MKRTFTQMAAQCLFEWQVALMAVTIGLIVAAIITANLGIGVVSVSTLLFLRAVDSAHKRWRQGGAHEGHEGYFLGSFSTSIIAAGIVVMIGGCILILL